jgi:hypothetical protein
VLVEEEYIWHGIIIEKLLNLVLDVKKLNWYAYIVPKFLRVVVLIDLAASSWN